MGVFAAKAIKKNVWLGEHLGDVITVAQASAKSNMNNRARAASAQPSSLSSASAQPQVPPD